MGHTHTPPQIAAEKSILLDLPEAARELGGIHVWTVRQLIAKREIRALKIGKRVMIERAEIARYVAMLRSQSEALISGTTAATQPRSPEIHEY